MTEQLEAQHEIKMTIRTPWQVGYSITEDTMFLYYFDQDDICWVFGPKGINNAGFVEFINYDHCLLLGYL